MSKPTKIPVPLSDGTNKYMILNWGALADAEAVLDGESLISTFSDGETAKKRLGFRAVLAVLWGGMKAAGSDLTYDQVGGLLDGERMGEYFEIVSRALNEFASGNKKPKNKPKEDSDPLETSPA